MSFKNTDFVCTSSHYEECRKVRRNALESTVDMFDVMNFLREVHGLPLIQVWVPCMCDSPEVSVTYDDNTCSFSNAPSRIIQLFCELTCFDKNMKYASEFNEIHSEFQAYFVKNGKGLVGRAYSLKKACFFRDTSQFTISDYPLVHLPRSSGLAACFAIPMQLIHPKIPPLILEVFLSPQQNCDINLGSLLKSLVTTMARRFSGVDVAFAFRLSKEFCVEFSHSDDDNFVYFDLYRGGRTMNSGETLGNRREEHPFQSAYQPPTLEDNVEHYETNDTAARNQHSIPPHQPNIQDIAETCRESFTNGDAQIILDAIRNKQVQVTTENLRGDQVQSRKALGSDREEQQFPSHQLLTLEGSVGNYESDATTIGNNESDAAAGNKLSSLSNNTNAQDRDDTSGGIFTKAATNITLDDLKPYFGGRLEVAAENLRVSRSTLKRRCRDFGINRWPSHPRNKVHHIQSIPRLLVEVGGEIIQESNIGHNNAKEEGATAANSIQPSAKGKVSEMGREEIYQSYTMIVKATHRKDTVKFPIRSNLGIEELRRELDESLDLQGVRFKIKYKEEGNWIMIARDKDLRYYMDTLKSSGQTIMNLSIFPDP